jgi:hypothetical protein
MISSHLLSGRAAGGAPEVQRIFKEALFGGSGFVPDIGNTKVWDHSEVEGSK